MRETAASLELKARTAELRQKLLELRGSRKSTSPNGGKHNRQPMNDGDIEALIRDITLANAKDMTTTTTSNNTAAAVASVAAAAVSPEMAKREKENVAAETGPMTNGQTMTETAKTIATEDDQTEDEIAEDIKDWLLFTNFYDKAYRKQFLLVHRRAAARRAALEAIEAQKRKLLEEMEQDDLVLVHYGPKTTSWTGRTPTVSPFLGVKTEVSRETTPNPSQPRAVSVQDVVMASVASGALATAPDASAVPAAPAPTLVATPPTAAVPAPAATLPTGPEVPVASAASAPIPAAPQTTSTSTAPVTAAAPASVSAAPQSALQTFPDSIPPVFQIKTIATATSNVKVAPVTIAASGSTAPDATTPIAPAVTAPATADSVVRNATAPNSTTSEATTVAPTTPPVAAIPVLTNKTGSIAPVVSPSAHAHPQRQALIAAGSPQGPRSQQKTAQFKRTFSEVGVNEEETNRPPKTSRTGPTPKNMGANYTPIPAQKKAGAGKSEKDVADKAQKGPSPQSTSAGADAAPVPEDTRPANTARTDKPRDKATTKKPATLPAKPISTLVDGISTESTTTRNSKSHSDAGNGHGEIRIRGAANSRPDSPARLGGPWFNADGSFTNNITIAGLARATRPLQQLGCNSKTADAVDDEAKNDGSLESQVVKAENAETDGRPLHERITKPLSLGRRGESRFFYMWAYNKANIRTSIQDKLWVTRIKDRTMLNKAFDTCRNVILFFFINKSNAFQGYARMTSRTIDSLPRSEWMTRIPTSTTSPFRLEWLNTTTTSFRKVECLKNPLNNGASVTAVKDGCEIDEDCARGLIKEMDAVRDHLAGKSAKNNHHGSDNGRPLSREERSPSYDFGRDGDYDHALEPNAYRRGSPERDAGYGGVHEGYGGNYGNDYGGGYDGDYGGGGGSSGSYGDSWVPEYGDSFRPQAWR